MVAPTDGQSSLTSLAFTMSRAVSLYTRSLVLWGGAAASGQET